jgi:predicted DCC family thiol-disulfide oxidoreductase YuxK
MTATNKRLLISESRGDSNRCTPCMGKPDQHVTYASHSSLCTSSVRFLWAVPVRDNLSLAPMKLKQAPTPGRSLDNQRQTGPAVVLGDLIPPPM